MTSNEPVIYTRSGAIAQVTLNRPETLNAMNQKLMTGISDAMMEVEKDKTVRVVVISGAGRGFCAGADLGNVGDTDDADAASAATSATESMDDAFNPAMRAIYNCPVPTIARVQGPAAGGGMGLALACDITIAARSAFFVATFGPKLGIVPDLGSTWSLPRRAGRARALGMSLLGDRITANQAESWGLIWKAVDDEDLDGEVTAIATQLSRTSPDAMTRIRQSIDAASGNTFGEQLDLEMAHQGVLIPRNMQEGAAAFMEKREPAFRGRS